VTILAPEPVLDIRSLPGTRETLAYQDGGLFPVLALTADRVAVAALRGGAGHIGREGRMEILRSQDGGLTWTPPNLIADSEDDDRNPAFGVSPHGTLILLYHRQHNYDADGNYQGRIQVADRRPVVIMATRSLDGGLTWEEPYPLSIDALPSGSPYGKVVSLADGTLLAPIYNSQAWEDERSGQSFDSSYLVRSRNDGLTWEEPSLIAHHKNETALIALPGGDLLAVMRDDGVQGLHSAHSQDGGFSWSDPVQITKARQHPADLVLLSNGDILLTYGNRNPPHRIEGRISRDRGRSWLDCLLTFSGHLYGYTTEESRRTDLGYPSSVVRGNGQAVTMYYYNPSMRQASDSRQAENNPLYSHQNYCAVAVTWQEEELIAAVARATSRQ